MSVFERQNSPQQTSMKSAAWHVMLYAAWSWSSCVSTAATSASLVDVTNSWNATRTYTSQCPWTNIRHPTVTTFSLGFCLFYQGQSPPVRQYPLMSLPRKTSGNRWSWIIYKPDALLLPNLKLSQQCRQLIFIQYANMHCSACTHTQTRVRMHTHHFKGHYFPGKSGLASIIIIIIIGSRRQWSVASIRNAHDGKPWTIQRGCWRGYRHQSTVSMSSAGGLYVGASQS